MMDEEKSVLKSSEKSKKIRLLAIIGGAVLILAAVILTLVLTLGSCDSGAVSGSYGEEAGASSGKSSRRDSNFRIDAATPDVFFSSLLEMAKNAPRGKFEQLLLALNFFQDPRYLDGMNIDDIIAAASLFVDLDTKHGGLPTDQAQYDAWREKAYDQLQKALSKAQNADSWEQLNLKDNAPVMVIRKFFRCMRDNDFDGCAELVLPTMREEFKKNGSFFINWHMKYPAVWIGKDCEIRGNKAGVAFANVEWNPDEDVPFILTHGTTLLTVRADGKWYFVPDIITGIARNADSFKPERSGNESCIILLQQIKPKYELLGSKHCAFSLKHLRPIIAFHSKNGKRPGEAEMRKLIENHMGECAAHCRYDLSAGTKGRYPKQLVMCQKHGLAVYDDGHVGKAKKR